MLFVGIFLLAMRNGAPAAVCCAAVSHTQGVKVLNFYCISPLLCAVCCGSLRRMLADRQPFFYCLLGFSHFRSMDLRKPPMSSLSLCSALHVEGPWNLKNPDNPWRTGCLRPFRRSGKLDAVCGAGAYSSFATSFPYI